MLIFKQIYQKSYSFLETYIFQFVYIWSCFFLPFLLGHPQTLVGVLVNASLLLTALKIKERFFLPIAILPSLGVLSRGLIFGSFTIKLLYIMPFIWLGNLVLMYLFKYLFEYKKVNIWLSLFWGAIAKTALLFSSAVCLVYLNILPSLFLETMGWFQLVTALVGGFIAIVWYKK